MNKLKTALCLSAALLATGAQAQWQPSWVLGVSGEYNWRGNDSDRRDSGFMTNDGSFTNFNVGNNGNNNDNNGWGWGLLGGYQAVCNSWLLGIELAVDWVNNGNDNNNNAFAFTNVASAAFPARGWNGVAGFDREYVVGLTGRLGYEMSPWFMPYLRAGIETGRDRASFLVSTGDNQNPFLTASGDSSRQSWRFVGGIGAEVPLPVLVDGLGIRAEWNYHSDGRSVGVASLANDNATLIGVNGKQDMNTAKVSLVYNFPA